ncbi:cupin [Prauserella marina]|nr:cupin domain-containing protein [Prauserella marina]ASR39260.1 cupin [Prauserella marina]
MDSSAPAQPPGLPEWTPLTHVEGKALLGGQGRVRLLTAAENGVLLEIEYPEGVASPVHQHDHDSVVYLLSGALEGTVSGEHVELHSGQALLHPAHVPHSVAAVTGSRWLEFKSPAPDLTRTVGVANP